MTADGSEVERSSGSLSMHPTGVRNQTFAGVFAILFGLRSPFIPFFGCDCALTEGDGLHEFWQSELDHRRIINSFDLVGSSAMVDVLNASQWCQTRNADLDQYSETEADYLASIEDDLHDALSELPEQVAEFIEDELTEQA